MTTPGIFNLLLLDDTNQDSYLVSQNLLKKRLNTIKKNNIKNIEEQIFEINKELNILSQNSYKIIDSEEFEKNKQKIIETTNKLNFLKKNYDDLIKPKQK